MYVDLHRHLEGSVRPLVIQHLTSDFSLAEIKRNIQVDGTERNLIDYISKLSTKYLKLGLDNAEKVERLGYEVVKSAYREELKYLELRACPLPIIQSQPQITISNYISALRKGMKKAEKDFQIRTNLIISIKRDDTEEENLQLVDELIKQFEKGNICGADLCGDEKNYPTKNYSKIFRRIRNAKIPITIHAGETGSTQSIKEAINLGARRIGHGTALIKDLELLKEIKDRNIAIECCITSNLHTKILKKIEDHPIRKYFDFGLNVTYNTDNPTTSDITIKSEEELLKNKFKFTPNEIIKLKQNSIQASFATNEIKKQLLTKLK